MNCRQAFILNFAYSHISYQYLLSKLTKSILIVLVAENQEVTHEQTGRGIVKKKIGNKNVVSLLY